MIKATYGHGTHNDFVLVFDENDQVQFTKDQIKRICDRTTGIGSDGFIKIIKKDGSWFMDYLNGECDEAFAKEETKRVTRAYARRQETWFSRDDRIKWLAPESKAGQLEKLLASIN